MKLALVVLALVVVAEAYHPDGIFELGYDLHRLMKLFGWSAQPAGCYAVDCCKQILLTLMEGEQVAGRDEEWLSAEMSDKIAIC